MIPEAEILHFVDVMDARMYDMFAAIENIDGGEVSDRIWSLDKRQVYKKTF
jgi:3'-5' exoribonuclease